MNWFSWIFWPLAIALALAGCGGDSILGPGSPTPTPEPQASVCPFSLSCPPIAGLKGVYACTVEPPGGATTINVNGTLTSVEFQVIVFGESGNVASACRGCGCSPPIVLR